MVTDAAADAETEDDDADVIDRDAEPDLDASQSDGGDGSLLDGGLDAGLDAALDAGPDAALDGATPDAELDGATLDGAGPIADAALDAGADGSATDGGAADAEVDGALPDASAVVCPGDNGGITLPPGFCATRYAENVIGARHLVVTPAGDLFVATAPRSGAPTSWVALRDENGDGMAERRETFGTTPGSGIDWENDYLYFAAHDRVLRYPLPNGQLVPTGAAEVVVGDLPASGDHYAKAIVVWEDVLFVNVGSASNSCQVANRQLESPGVDPCPELTTRASVFKLSAVTPNQTLANATRFATGVRNATALALRRGLGKLFTAQNSRDQLHENWPDQFSAADDVRLPAEGVFYLREGDDYGWPYCYYDAEAGKYFLAPEYGGDGETEGARCMGLRQPVSTLPAHWAPLGMAFYENSAFPAHYRNGAFIANHGSRFAPNASEPLPGYNVVFIPFQNQHATGPYERFAEGFAGSGRPLPEQAAHRPVGLAVAGDGALFVSDDWGGTIWRISYRGP